MKKLFVILGIVLCLIILSIVVRCIVYETEFEIIKTENNKMFFAVIDQKGMSNREHQISIYSGFKNTGFHYDDGVNDFNIRYDCTFNDIEYYEINILNDIGYTTTYLHIYSDDINKTLEKSMLVDEFNEYNYDNIKEYITEKIYEGEIEWLYSYGDALLSEEQYEILDVVKNINTLEQCKNDFIEAELLYEKRNELLQKYGGEQ